jgi:hypothetical protein
MNMRLAWRIILTIMAIIFTLNLVPVVTSLTIDGKNFLRESINSMFRPLSMEGESRQERLIELCLYLVAATLIIKYVWRN